VAAANKGAEVIFVEQRRADPESSPRVGTSGPDAPGVGSSQFDNGAPRATRRATLGRQLARVVAAIRNGDDNAVQEVVVELSRRHRLLAPLALLVGTIAMLFEGVKLLVTNWRLTLVQLLPAMWIWVAMIDLKAHALHGKSFHVLRGPILIPIVLAIVAVTAGSFFLNAVFAFAVSKPGHPAIRPAFTEARKHHRTVLGSGAAIGLLLGFSTVVVVRWGLGWFTLSLGIVVAMMMVAYVTVPARLIGMDTKTAPRGEKLKAAAVGGILGAVVCSPPYLLGRIGLLMLGSNTLFLLGIVLLTVGLVLEAGATSAVKTIKLSAKLVAGQPVESARPTQSESRAGAGNAGE
jgi:uncharacterized membrane protein